MGYLQPLEQIMLKAFPGTDLKANPHINSRITTWKKNYSRLFSMLSRTGIGLNPKTKMIEVTDEMWDSYTKVDPNALLIMHKSWPFYDDWCEIFEEDRAIGVGAEDFVEAANQGIEGGTQKKDAANGQNDGFFEGFNDEMEEMSVCQPICNAARKKSIGKKRKSSQGLDAVSEIINFCQDVALRLGEIAARIGFEYDTSNAWKKVFEFVKKMDDLTLQDKLLASQLLV